MSRLANNAESPNETETPFSSFDVFVQGSLLSRLNGICGLGSRRQRIGLIAIICLPLFVLGVASAIEGRFLLGSLSVDLPGTGRVLGMSFLGDTMVWPFAFIVPMAFLLLNLAVSRSVRLLNAVARHAEGSWSGGDVKLDQIVASTKQRLSRQRGTSGRLMRIMPWFVAILFWLYNTTTCALHTYIPDALYPYITSQVTCTTDANAAPIVGNAGKHQRTLNLSRPVALPKWDCDVLQAPLSCLLARIWTFFYYGLPPFILAHLIGLVVGVVYFLGHVNRCKGTQECDENSHIHDIQPFALDGFGGLGSLAETGMSYIYVLSCFILLMSMSFLKEGATPAWHNLVLMLMFMPIAIAVFLAPSAAVRTALVRAKRNYLVMLGAQMNEISARITAPIHPQSVTKDTAVADYYRLQSLKMLHDQVSSVPEWPFSSRTVVRIILSLGMPVFLVLLDKVLGLLFRI